MQVITNRQILRFLIPVFCLLNKNLPAQLTPVTSEPLKQLYYFEFKRECPVYRCDLNGQKTDTAYLVAPRNARFLLVDLKQDIAVIRFVLNKYSGWINSASEGRAEDFFQYKYFLISKAQLDFKAIPVLTSRVSFTIGNIVNTAKFRIRPFELGKEISLGPSAGIRFPIGRTGDYHFLISVNMGFSTITIDSFTTSGILKKGESEDLFAFSPGMGLVYAFGSAQVGLFSGMDILPGRKESYRRWIYRNQPWLALGIGFSIYSGTLKP